MSEDEIVVQPYDWKVYKNRGEEGQDVIYCWCLNRESKANLVRIENFPVTCQVELPIWIKGGNKTWSPNDVDIFYNKLCERMELKKPGSAPFGYTFKYKKKLYYFKGKKTYPMMTLQFLNDTSLRFCKNLLKYSIFTNEWGYIKCNLWEDNIGLEKKMLTAKKMEYGQWFRTKATKVVDSSEKVSKVELEYLVNWKHITPIDADESREWSTHPGILAFDIECYSDIHKALPQKFNAKHEAYMISCIYARYGCKERKRYGIIIGDCNNVPKDRLDNCEITRVNNENELVQEFGRIISETDPEIITGYNIYGFDYPYLQARLDMRMWQWPDMGRLLLLENEEVTMENINWSSGAYGQQDLYILNITGRISIDLYPLIQRDYKLPKYDLNTVCMYFLKKSKHPVTAKQMFVAYEKAKKVDASPEEKAESMEEMREIMEYCIKDSELTIDLIEKLNIWTALIEMSNIVGVPIVAIFTRGQQVRCLNKIFDDATCKDYVLDARENPPYPFAGGFVHEPIPGLYDNVLCLDFSSLYPSIIIAYNICYTTLVPDYLFDKVADEECNIIEFEQEEIIKEYTEVVNGKKRKIKETEMKKYKFKFMKKPEGLLPSIVRGLIEKRRGVKNMVSYNSAELKAVKKIDSISEVINDVIEGNKEILDIKSSTDHYDMLSKQDPYPDVQTMSDAKKSIFISELFDFDHCNKNFEKIQNKNDTPPFQKQFTELSFEIASSYKNNKFDRLVEIKNELDKYKEDRLAIIQKLDLLLVVLDKRQWAIKIATNSYFGFLGVKNGGKLPLVEGAMSITALGRKLINDVRVYIEDKYNGVQVYGDTDSVMVDLGIKDSKDCYYWGTRLAEEISGLKKGKIDCDGNRVLEDRKGLFPPPLAMEFEKAMRLLCLKKKKYAAYFIGKDGSFKRVDVYDENGNIVGSKMFVYERGIILARRDNCQFHRKTYKEIVNIIMAHGTLLESFSSLFANIKSLINGEIDVVDLEITKGYSGNYKSETAAMKVFADNLLKKGIQVNPNERLGFIFVENPSSNKASHKMYLTERYIQDKNTPDEVKIDYNHYLEKVLKNSIDQLFAVGYKNLLPKLNFAYKAKRKRNPVGLDQPLTLLSCLIKDDNLDFDHLYSVIEKKYNDVINVKEVKIFNNLRLNIIG